jgi:nitroreductase/NAD-dependent dihydropyrimidine dehydrogenase PreA subunit
LKLGLRRKGKAMSIFQIDKALCSGDGLCAHICPAGLITMTQDQPLPIPDAESRCTVCGHCVAVCPTGAFSLKHMTAEKCPPISSDMFVDETQMVHRIRSRRSIRHFTSAQPKRELVKRLLEAVRYAPSGHNCQPVEFLVVEGHKAVKRFSEKVVEWMRHAISQNLVDKPMRARYRSVVATHESGGDRILRNAPVLIVAHAPRNLYASRPACIIALTYAELAAPSFGLGVCWMGYFMTAAEKYSPLRDMLDIPKDHEPFGALIMGEPLHVFQRLPQRNPLQIKWQTWKVKN